MIRHPPNSSLETPRLPVLFQSPVVCNSELSSVNAMVNRASIGNRPSTVILIGQSPQKTRIRRNGAPGGVTGFSLVRLLTRAAQKAFPSRDREEALCAKFRKQVLAPQAGGINGAKVIGPAPAPGVELCVHLTGKGLLAGLPFD